MPRIREATRRKMKLDKRPRSVSDKPEANETVKKIYKRYTDGMTILNRPFVFFNMKSPIQYWAEGRRRFNVFVPPRAEGSEDWKTIYKSMMTRNKCLGIIAHSVSMMMSPSIQAQNENQEEDVQVSQFFKDNVEFSQEKEGFEVKLFWAICTAVAEGTTNLMDCYGIFERDAKEITSFDGDLTTMRWKEGKKTDFEGAYTEQVANDEILFPNPFINDIQDQDWLIVRKRMTLDQAKKRYGKFAKFDNVKGGASTRWNWVSDFFESFDSFAHLGENEVEVLLHWEKEGDHFDIVINGEQLTVENFPNPREDKLYPLSHTGYEPIDANFMWFKAATDKLSQEQDVFDTVMRMFIDRQHLRNIPALLTSNPALVNENIIVPGLVTYKGDTNETVETIKGIDDGTDQATINLLQTMMSQASESSLDPMQMGNKAAGGTPTATQALQMAQSARIMLGLFGWMIGKMVTDWTKLRLNTIIWLMAKNEDLSQITLNDRVIQNGRIGKRTYVMEPGLSTRSTEEKDELSKLIHKAEKKSNGKLNIVAIDPSTASKLAYYVRLDAQPQPKRTDALMQALAMEKWNVYSAAPQVFNLNAAAVKLSQAWGDNPDEMVIEQNNAQDPMQMLAGAGQQQSQTPVMSQMNGGLKQRMGMKPQGGAPVQAAAPV